MILFEKKKFSFVFLIFCVKSHCKQEKMTENLEAISFLIQSLRNWIDEAKKICLGSGVKILKNRTGKKKCKTSALPETRFPNMKEVRCDSESEAIKLRKILREQTTAI